MNKEKLIEEVRRYPYLYDASDAKYADSVKRDQTWKSIARTLSSTESECKKTWANLRESYRRAVVKKRTKSGQAATTSKKWQFEEEMSFLLPHMKQRKTISSLTEDDSEVDENVDVNELLSNHDDSSMSLNEELNITNRPESSATNTSANSPLFPNIPKRKRLKGTQECTSASAQLLQYLLKEKEAKKDDEIDQFFSSIATTVKKLNRYSQSVLKSRIFNMVSEFELQEIQEQTNFYAGASRYNTDIESPSIYNTHNIGPSGYNTDNTGPSGYNTHNIRSSNYNLHNAGPSGYNTRTAGSSDYNIHNAGPSDSNTPMNAELSGNNPPVLEESILNSELPNAKQNNDS
ncbi:transcription factor Adf-1-like [Pectinophora gossypiella]|uniref:transcription factor Adf-1-like n=1 Tax=Pectinophora gossypiella TaxID=13191 RepID=UPI00214F1FA5|nr:transcription factor Adf-1-like [Pectinophora gossypiella]XP_049877071.1 transcription factor Adf-1-like [Pectinophora gossypiella]XP_049880394.1 transcription factor Adf-1-like [Pectinophora gossypiella]XP_049884299.1 transcription factor Adf-1-like [Pectinophora gossypiella]